MFRHRALYVNLGCMSASTEKLSHDGLRAAESQLIPMGLTTKSLSIPPHQPMRRKLGRDSLRYRRNNIVGLFQTLPLRDESRVMPSFGGIIMNSKSHSQTTCRVT